MNPYKVLGVSESATIEEIKAAYRDRATRYHPDAGGDSWAFQQLQEAYEELLARHEASAKPKDAEPQKTAQSREAATSGRERPSKGGGRSSHTMKPAEFAVIGGIVALLLGLYFWEWMWRLLVVITALGLAAFAVFCGNRVLRRTDDDGTRYRLIGATVASAIAAVVLFFIGIMPRQTNETAVDNSPRGTATESRTVPTEAGPAVSAEHHNEENPFVDALKEQERKRYAFSTGQPRRYQQSRNWALVHAIRHRKRCFALGVQSIL